MSELSFGIRASLKMNTYCCFNLTKRQLTGNFVATLYNKNMKKEKKVNKNEY